MDITVVGIDPSMSNTALVAAQLTVEKGAVVSCKVFAVTLLQTTKAKNKTIRASSDLISRCRTLNEGTKEFVKKWSPKMVFAETPSGSQSSSGMKSYGVSCFLTSTIDPAPLEVTPDEVKKASVGTKTASKAEMIAWATTKHPEANWPKKGGKIVAGKAEHIADAIATIYAGIKTPEFSRVIGVMG